MTTKPNRLTRLNNAIVQSADNLAAALVILLGVYLLAELHNYTALVDFAQLAGVHWILSYTTPVMLGVFVLVIYWVLIAYKAKGYKTFAPWVIVWLFVLGSVALNLLHYGLHPAGIAMSILAPALILFGGYLAKDIVSKQVSELHLIKGIEMLKADEQAAQQAAQTARETCTKIEQVIAQLTADFEAQKAAIRARIEDLEAEEQAAIVQRDQAKLSIDGVDSVPEDVRQAIQLDALIAAGMSKTAAAKLCNIGRNTVNARLEMVNGSGLRHRAEGVQS